MLPRTANSLVRVLAGKISQALLVASVALALAGCAVRLAPSYDQAIFDGLSKANEEAMTLFAATSAGVSASTYTKRQKQYEELIGKLDALRLQAATRSDPQPGRLVGFIVPSAERQPEERNPLASPTRHFIENMVRIFIRMRDRDKRSGLLREHVAILKNEFEIEMDNALTYEKALNRQEMMMSNVPSVEEVVAAITNAASGTAKKEGTAIRDFADRQRKRLAQHTVLLANLGAAGGLSDPADQKEFLDGLEEVTKDFVLALKGLALVAVEKIWNAIVDVIWGLLDKAVGFALPRPSAFLI